MSDGRIGIRQKWTSLNNQWKAINEQLRFNTQRPVPALWTISSVPQLGQNPIFNRWLFAQPRRTLDFSFSGGNVVDLEGTKLISFRLSVTNRIGMILFKDWLSFRGVSFGFVLR